MRGPAQTSGAATFDDDERGEDNVDGTELRQLWAEVSGDLYGLDFKVQVDFADNDVTTRDLYLARTLGPGKLTVGQSKPVFGIEDRTSLRFISLMERAYLEQALAPSWRVGATYYGATPSAAFTYGASVYNLDSGDADAAEGTGYGFRVTAAPLRSPGRVVHVGTSVLREHYGSDSSDNGKQGYSVNLRTAGHMADASRAQLLSFNNGSNVDVTKALFDFAVVLGSVSLQAEAAIADAKDEVQEGDLAGYYGFVSWFLTGESRNYDAKNGRFGRITPQNAYGAVELVARYDVIGSEQNVIGGADLREVELDSLTAGVTWYVNPNVRAMLNYIVAETRDELTASTVDETSALMARLQFDF